MKLEELMSGIAVVIDDKLGNITTGESSTDRNEDLITNIVKQLAQKWSLPFYATEQMPPSDTWPNLLQAASFVLLDWKLWPPGSATLEQEGVKRHIEFLDLAKDYLVPVFIFTNEDPEDIASRLPPDLYVETSPEKSFIFIKRKSDLIPNNSLNFACIENWITQNASVYALKAWEQEFYAAKKELFGRMHAKNPDWPSIFWKAYDDDSVDPGSSLMHLINDNLLGRMRTNVFESGILTKPGATVPEEDLRSLIGETSCRPESVLLPSETRCGDLFLLSRATFLLNLLPDCDCVPRGDEAVDNIELHCVKGKRIRNRELVEKYRMGHFDEVPWESIVFSICNGKSVRFDFRRLQIERFSELRDKRIGRLLHPYLTRIQQRYALYVQRQGLPRIPKEAIPLPPTKD